MGLIDAHMQANSALALLHVNHAACCQPTRREQPFIGNHPHSVKPRARLQANRQEDAVW
jgi:hypothetical protein